LAYGILYFDWDRKSAEGEFKRAIELNPNYAIAHRAYALHLGTMGRFDEATVEIKRSQELEPVSLIGNTLLGSLFYWSRQYDQAIEQFQKALEMNPNSPFAHVWLGRAYEQRGRLPESMAEFQKASRLDDTPTVQSALGHDYAVAGRRGEAHKVIDELMETSNRSYVPPTCVAAVYVGLGEKEQALAWLEKAYEIRDANLPQLKVDPVWDSIRSDRRFIELLRKVGLS
jgi:tetratricopeptide (TPR) repeat protein